MDLEKAFDGVLREVVWCAVRYMGVDNGLIQVIQSMYNDPETTVKFKGGSTRFLGKTPCGVLPLCDDRRTPASSLLSLFVQSEAVVYLENGLT